VRVQVNPRLAGQYGLNLADVRTAIVNAERQPAQGQLRRTDARDRRWTPTTSCARPRNTGKPVIAWRDGAPLRLGDVADVIDGAAETPARRVAERQRRRPCCQCPAPARRQRHRGGRSHQALLPQLRPAARRGRCERADRPHATIRASVRDVQHRTDLRGRAGRDGDLSCSCATFAATIIPSVAVPLSLVGTFGVMYLAGYSLNNLTLMALTIATGFVVDDAIVMIENIARYARRAPPMEAALKGAKQIGFTIISLTVSLIAVLIPLLFMQRRRRPAVPSSPSRWPWPS
jgi:multidrug efflux pump